MTAPDREDAPDARELAEDQADWVAAYDREIAENVRQAAQKRATAESPIIICQPPVGCTCPAVAHWCVCGAWPDGVALAEKLRTEGQGD